MSGPAKGRREHATILRALLPCLVLIPVLTAFAGPSARAQTLTPDMLRPERDGFVLPQDSPLRRTAGNTIDKTDDAAIDPRLRDKDTPAPSRIGNIPTYGLPAANGASDSGFDSLNRTRKKPKFYPGQVKPKPSPGPGSPAPVVSAAPAIGQLRLSIPPSDSANKAPLPPAMVGTVEGQPARRRLKVDDDPFGAVGDYAGSFLIKSAVELSGGYDTNPGRVLVPQGSPFYVVAPEFLAVSQLGTPRAGRRPQGIVHRLWQHFSAIDRRRGFLGADQCRPPGFYRPYRRPPRCHRGHPACCRKCACASPPTIPAAPTSRPASPAIRSTPRSAAPSASTRISTACKSPPAAPSTAPPISSPELTDGTMSSNDDRNFNQYGGIGRVSYDLLPGLKPFVEVEGDSRVHDLQLDRSGYARDSNGGYAKAGTSFEFTRLLTGEISVGFAARDYADPRLERLQGLLVASSLTWTATPLTTAKFYSNTSIDETTLPGTSGVLTHTYTFEVDHDFRRWLTAIGKFTYGTLDYQGDGRRDQIYTIEGDLVYKMTRNLWIKGTLRRDVLDSNIVGSSSASTVVMLGVRLQN